MAIIDCDVCADRARRHWVGVVLATVLSPLVWVWVALTIIVRLVQPHRRRQPRVCLLAGSRPVRRDTTRALRRVLGELARFETKVPVDLLVVQDRVTRADGEPLRVAVQRTRRGTSALFTIRLALHARGTCYGPEAVAATLADTLVALYEREAQITPVLELPARVPKEAPLTAASSASGRHAVGGGGRSRTLVTNGTAVLARAIVDEEADGTVSQFKPRPGGLSSDDPA
jgi:hypothetical protein